LVAAVDSWVHMLTVVTVLQPTEVVVVLQQVVQLVE